MSHRNAHGGDVGDEGDRVKEGDKIPLLPSHSQSNQASAMSQGTSQTKSSDGGTEMRSLQGEHSQSNAPGAIAQGTSKTTSSNKGTKMESSTGDNSQSNPAGAKKQRDEPGATARVIGDRVADPKGASEEKSNGPKQDPKQELKQWHEDDKGGNKDWLKGLIRTLVFSPFKWYRGSCWISIPHLIVFILYVAKLGSSTHAVFTFGVCRDQLSDAITHGQAVLKHNMLKAWSAEYETLPYPPSIGPFAVYNIEDFIDRIHFAVEGYYNMEYQATGHFKILPNDQMEMHFRYIVVSDTIIGIKSSRLEPIHGLKNYTKDGRAVYKYDLMKELEHNNLTDVFNSILDVTLTASLHSLRVLRNGAFLCLKTHIKIEHNDNDLNGEVDIGLRTTTKTVSCQRLNITTIDSAMCEKNTEWLAICVFVLTTFTIVFDVFSFVTGLFICGLYHNKANIQNFCSYLVRWWSLVPAIGDGFIFIGQSMFYNENKDRVEKKLRIFDEIAFYYGIGCLLCWIGAMRYLKINRNFSLLFHTMYHAKSNILAFVLCTGTLFVGYWAFAFVTFGVYHPKFETKILAAESLFALIYADDIFGTVSSVHYELAGSESFLRASVIIVIYSFVILFTLLALNLIIALINTSYTTIKEIDDNNLDQQEKNGTVLMFDYLNGVPPENRPEGGRIVMWIFYPKKYWQCISNNGIEIGSNSNNAINKTDIEFTSVL